MNLSHFGFVAFLSVGIALPVQAEMIAVGGAFGESYGGSAPARKSVRKTVQKKSVGKQKISTRNQRPKANRSAGAEPQSASNEKGTSVNGGEASCYWQPQPLASGGRFDPNKLTAAHRTLPFGTKVKVTSANGKSVVVTINDRGPYAKDKKGKPRVIDLSDAACKVIGNNRSVSQVKLEVIGKASKMELASLRKGGN